MSAMSEFATGARLFARGFGIVMRSPGLLFLGLVPGVIAGLLVVAALGTLVYFIDDVSATATWFADDWSAELRDPLRQAASIGIVLAAVLLSIVTFTALTMIIGDPFYEEISTRIDNRFGGAPDAVDAPWYRTAWPNLSDSLRLLAVSIALSALLLLAGCVPVVGQTVVPVLQVMLGGALLGVEISGVAFNRRGYRLRRRWPVLRANKGLLLGFGVPVFLLFLIPFAAVLVMPGAVAGATLMTRRIFGYPHGEVHSGH